MQNRSRMDHHFVDEVRNSVSIVQVISEYVTLRKSGRDYSARCPFHSEKTPSFYVSEAKKIFKCFGCGVAGDVFSFVSKIEGVSFPEALKMLAQKAGIPMPERHESPAQSHARERLFTIMEAAAQFYQTCLEQAEEPVAAHLADRGIGKRGLEQFRIGYAPRTGNALLQKLRKQGFEDSEIDRCGLLKSTGPASFHDKFRGRIIIPITNLSGKVMALGGRIFGEGIPKYLNSPETPIYSKGNSLFGLYLSREQIRQKDFAILVEGYFDLIVPFLNGVRNVVASLGTSLTANQVKLIGRYTRNIVVNYDPDSAGVAAAARSIDLFLQEGFRVNVVSLPGGMDPDSFVRTEGVEAYLARLKTSAPYIDFLLESAMRDAGNAMTPKGKANVLNQLLPYVAKLPNRVERAETVSRLAEKLHLESSLVLSELRRVALDKGTQAPVRQVLPQEFTRTEQRLLKLLVESGEARDEVLPSLQPEDYRGLMIEPFLRLMVDFFHRRQEVTFLSLQNELSGEEQKQLFAEIVLASSADPEPSRTDAFNCLNALRRLSLERARQDLQERIVDAEKGRRAEELDRLYREKQEITRQLQLLV